LYTPLILYNFQPTTRHIMETFFMDFYKSLGDKRQSLNVNEQNILNYILKNVNQLNQLNVRQIAKDNFTVPNSIIRVCKKLGYNGYLQFREVLLNSTIAQKTDIQTTPQIHNLNRTASMINLETLNITTRLLQICNCVNVFAFGLSRFVANEFLNRLMLIGKAGQFFYDLDMACATIEKCKENEIAFLISLSGESPEIIQIANLAKLTPLTTISITNLSNNTISRLTNHNFYAIANELKYKNMDIANRLGLAYVCNTIFDDYIDKTIYNNKDY